MELLLPVLFITFLFIMMVMFGDEVVNDINAYKINGEKLDKLIKEKQLSGTIFKSHNGTCAAVLDKSKKELHVFYPVYQNKTNHQINFGHSSCRFDEILESEVVIDSQTVTKSSKLAMAGGAVLGGVLAGGVGAIIGGLSGNKKQFDRIKRMEIKLTINNLDNPVQKITFLDGRSRVYRELVNGHHKNSEEYKEAIKQVDKWQAMFDVIIKNNS